MKPLRKITKLELYIRGIFVVTASILAIAAE